MEKCRLEAGHEQGGKRNAFQACSSSPRTRTYLSPKGTGLAWPFDISLVFVLPLNLFKAPFQPNILYVYHNRILLREIRESLQFS